MNRAFAIDGRMVGPGHPCYVIAELSANHGQDFGHAVRILRAAKDAGADAVKLQTYTADTLTINSDRPEFQIGQGTLWEGRNLYRLYEEAFTPWDWQPRLQDVAKELGLGFFSTPFDATAVDFLEAMNVPAHKIASFELVDLELIRCVARTGKPTIISTGMATLEEIEDAVAAFREAGGLDCALLKCNSAYPAPLTEMNLRTLPDLASRFDVPVGLSDHTMEVAAPVIAVALGACIVEKHLTLRRSDGGPDSGFSLEPDEFRAMVVAVREAESALGKVNYEATPREQASRLFRKSLFVVEDVKTGEKFTTRNVRVIRPGHGLPPKHLPGILGSAARRDLSRGEPLRWEDVA